MARRKLCALAFACFLSASTGCASSSSSTSRSSMASGSSTTSGSSTAADEVDICVAWRVWTPGQKDQFLGPIWDKTMAAVRPTLESNNMNEQQIETFSGCWHRSMPEFSQSLDRTCAMGGRVTSEDLGTQAAETYVPPCIEAAGRA